MIMNVERVELLKKAVIYLNTLTSVHLEILKKNLKTIS
jgi:hypothetical protein